MKKLPISEIQNRLKEFDITLIGNYINAKIAKHK